VIAGSAAAAAKPAPVAIRLPVRPLAGRWAMSDPLESPFAGIVAGPARGSRSGRRPWVRGIVPSVRRRADGSSLVPEGRSARAAHCKGRPARSGGQLAGRCGDAQGARDGRRRDRRGRLSSRRRDSSPRARAASTGSRRSRCMPLDGASGGFLRLRGGDFAHADRSRGRDPCRPADARVRPAEPVIPDPPETCPRSAPGRWPGTTDGSSRRSASAGSGRGQLRGGLVQLPHGTSAAVRWARALLRAPDGRTDAFVRSARCLPRPTSNAITSAPI
jgi:hypothetical protein